MLDEHGIDHRYRDYRREPLSEDELRRVFDLLGAAPGELLRKRDKANKELRLTGDEPPDELIRHMAEHPTLLQRPIGLRDGRAVLGRPVENLLELRDGV
ncbi:MAG: ArsC/Spx/MgsR family protein [Acidobacteriota bacterium]